MVTDTVDRDTLDRLVRDVDDPELPHVTIGDLGIVRSVDVDGDRAVVVLTPTYSGCPATEQIRDDVADAVTDAARARVEVIPTFSGCPAIAYIGADIESAALGVDGIEAVDVVWRRDIGWGPERITESGRATLTEAGIAPPGSGQALVQLGRRPSADPVVDGVTCPHCGSRNTRDDSPFGSAPCRSTHSCRSCRTPFDAIKDF